MWDLIVSVPDHCLSFYLCLHSLDFVDKCSKDMSLLLLKQALFQCKRCHSISILTFYTYTP